MVHYNLDYELENRLINWAYWVIAFEKNEVGYPPKSTIADFGLTDSHVRQSKPPFPLNNLHADEMNGWINIMGNQHPEYKTAIGAFYLRKKGMKIWEIAQVFKIPVRTFKQHLHDGRTWLSGRLSVDF